MKEIELKVTEEEYELLEAFRSGRDRSFEVYGDKDDQVLAVDHGGGFTFADCSYADGAAPMIAAAFNGLFRSLDDDPGEDLGDGQIRALRRELNRTIDQLHDTLKHELSPAATEDLSPGEPADRAFASAQADGVYELTQRIDALEAFDEKLESWQQ